jgi:2-oxo-4-hydroxy-4-carboxy--5-ureidoimidazoline (OHCU) decarboxylase
LSTWVSERLLPAPALAALDPEGLNVALRPLWEDARGLASRLAGRSFGSWTELIDSAEQEIEKMDDRQRAALLEAHPPLGAEPAQLRARSANSWKEQTSGGVTTEATARRLGELNRCYQRQFGFPFVEWVAGRPLTAIVEVLEDRLQRDRATELAAGCAALVAIARDRLRRIEGRRPTPNNSRERDGGRDYESGRH